MLCIWSDLPLGTPENAHVVVRISEHDVLHARLWCYVLRLVLENMMLLVFDNQHSDRLLLAFFSFYMFVLWFAEQLLLML